MTSSLFSMVASVTAAWLIAAQSKRRRQFGFWWVLASNVPATRSRNDEHPYPWTEEERTG